MIIVSASTLLSFLAACQAPKAPFHFLENEALDRIAKIDRIDVIRKSPTFPIKTNWGVIEGKQADPKSVRAYIPLFVREWSLLPPSLIAKAKLKKVVFCEDLSFAGQRRNAVPDWENDVLYYDVSSVGHRARYLAAVIHHEFFHLVDYRDDGLVYEDEPWAALNPMGFKYGSGGKNAQNDKSTTAFSDKFPGFLTHYGATGVEEDKAELFAHLVVNAAHVKTRAKDDAVLRAKIARLKKLLADFCPDVDDAFWTKAEKIDRPAM